MMGIGSEALNCIACEDRPYAPNDPCAVCGKTYATALPDGMEVVEWLREEAQDADEGGFDLRADKFRHAADTISQAHSIIAALRAKLDEAIDRAKVWEHYWQHEVKVKGEVISWCKDYQAKLETAEAEVKRLTEDNEALRKGKTEIAMTAVAADGQAQEAYEKLSVAEARIKAFEDALSFVHRWAVQKEGNGTSAEERLSAIAHHPSIATLSSREKAE